jgi:catechol 2,3-dioxygenase-like lactoylglutathione lyase family enzyme
MKLVELARFTVDVKAMEDFYRALLGTEPVAASDDMAIFMSGDTKVFIHKTYPPSAGELPPENHTAFAVEDVDAACKALAQKGLTIDVPPKDYYWGRSAYLRDPDGNLIEITAARRIPRDPDVV